VLVTDVCEVASLPCRPGICQFRSALTSHQSQRSSSPPVADSEASGPRHLLAQLRKALPYLLSERREALERHRFGRTAYSSELLTMGRASYGEPQVCISPADQAHVYAGAFVSIGPEVIFLEGGNHRTDWVTTYPIRARFGLPGAYEDGHPSSKGDLLIGNDVWIGRGARVLSGVTIGDGAVVGGYSLVATDVRPYAIVVGNPAHEIRRRFSDEQVHALLEIAWWNWPMGKIQERVAELCDSDIDGFIARNRS
jgi:acetyltransferase-like isoleucine patch superfamily enzyme